MFYQRCIQAIIPAFLTCSHRAVESAHDRYIRVAYGAHMDEMTEYTSSFEKHTSLTFYNNDVKSGKSCLFITLRVNTALICISYTLSAVKRG